MWLADGDRYHIPKKGKLGSFEEKEAMQEITILSDRRVLWPLPPLGLGVCELLWALRISLKNLKDSSTLRAIGFNFKETRQL